MPLLNNNLLQHLQQQDNPSISLPKYNREKLKAGIVHLGLGAFHRSHQAWYTEHVLNESSEEELNWGIIACSIRSGQVRNELEKQDTLYCLQEQSERARLEIIGCIKEVLVIKDEAQKVIDRIADQSIHIVTLTVTEKGYGIKSSAGELNWDLPEIQHDLQALKKQDAPPQTVIGVLVAALQKRKTTNAPLSIISCDNLPGNGKLLESAVCEFATMVDPELCEWINKAVSFPSTMVDRITPATTPKDIAQFQHLWGFNDNSLINAEPFSQWVIENRFKTQRPAWEKAGVAFVEDVESYEIMKLRLLNGSHSLLAYAGFLSGCETINQCMSTPNLKTLCQKFMACVEQSIEVPQGFDIKKYQSELIERFANPALAHRTFQIATDGSQKIPQRWLNSLSFLEKNKQDGSIICLALAAWIRFCRGENEQGELYEINDPMGETLRKLANTKKDQALQQVAAFTQIQSIFIKPISENIQSQIAVFLERIDRVGIERTIKDYLETGA